MIDLDFVTRFYLTSKKFIFSLPFAVAVRVIRIRIIKEKCSSRNLPLPPMKLSPPMNSYHAKKYQKFERSFERLRFAPTIPHRKKIDNQDMRTKLNVDVGNSHSFRLFLRSFDLSFC